MVDERRLRVLAAADPSRGLSGSGGLGGGVGGFGEHVEVVLDVGTGFDDGGSFMVRSVGERTLRGVFELNAVVSVHGGRVMEREAVLITGLAGRFLCAGEGFLGLMRRLLEGPVLAETLGEAELFALARWLFRGVVVERQDRRRELVCEVRARWNALGATPAGAREVLDRNCLAVVDTGSWFRGLSAVLAGRYGFVVTDGMDGAQRVVCVLGCYEQVAQFHDLAYELSDRGLPWMAVVVFPGYCVVLAHEGGPEGCLACSVGALHHGAYSVASGLQGFVFRGDLRVSEEPVGDDTVVEVADAIAKMIAGAGSSEHVVALPRSGGRAGLVERLVRRGTCVLCATSGAVGEAGGDPGSEDDVAQWESLMLRSTGLFGGVCGPLRMQRFYWDLEGAWAFVVIGTTVRRSLRSWGVFRNRGAVSGKGVSLVAASLGAIGEAVERSSAQFGYHRERMVRGAFDELRGRGTVVLPSALSRFSDAQFEAREAINREIHVHYVVPVRFLEEDGGLLLYWMEARGYGDRGQCVLVPASYVVSGVPAECWRVGEGDVCSHFCAWSSSGLAAGRTYRDAMYRAFLEVVERDAVARFWYCGLHQGCRSLDQVRDPWLSQAERRFADAGRRLQLIEVCDFAGCSVIVALSSLRNANAQGSYDVVVSSGAAGSALRAAVRAVGENLQFLNPVQESVFLGDVNSLDLRAWVARCREPVAGFETGDVIPLSEGDAGDAGWDRLGMDAVENERFEGLIGELADHGMSVYFVDLTVAGLGFQVARAIVPELCHPWHHLGHPRLVDAGFGGIGGERWVDGSIRPPIPVFF